MSLRSGKLPFLGSEDEFIDHRRFTPGSWQSSSPARFWGRPERSKATPCKALPSNERASCIEDSAAFSFDEPQATKFRLYPPSGGTRERNTLLLSARTGSAALQRRVRRAQTPRLSDFSSCPTYRGPEGPHYPCKPDTSTAEQF